LIKLMKFSANAFWKWSNLYTTYRKQTIIDLKLITIIILINWAWFNSHKTHVCYTSLFSIKSTWA
jgi:hypothetical protein